MLVELEGSTGRSSRICRRAGECPARRILVARRAILDDAAAPPAARRREGGTYRLVLGPFDGSEQVKSEQMVSAASGASLAELPPYLDVGW